MRDEAIDAQLITARSRSRGRAPAVLAWSLVLLLLLHGAGQAQEVERIALVIGNGAYADAPLANPPNDARLIAKTLRDLGFEVLERVDVDQTAMKRAIQQFADRLDAADRDAVGLFYYAGHGIQVGGENFLIPVDAEIRRESDVAIEAVSASGVLGVLDFARNRLNVVIMDACRNNPYARSFRSASRGLARMDAPQGTLIAYATAPGDVARDGDAGNSPYSAALAAEMRVPGIPVEQMFKEVRRSVAAATDGMQIPWESSSLIGDFYFNPAPAAVPGEPPVDPDALFWQSISGSENAQDFADYLARFPAGAFAALAARRLEALSAEPPGLERAPPGTGRREAGQALLPNEAIRAATWVDLDFDGFPVLPAAEVPARNVLFVATTGKDANRGTMESPFASIADALRRAAAGATVVVRGGEYRETFAADDHRALVIERDDLTLTAYPGEAVTVRPGPGVHHGLVINAQKFTVRGISLSGFRNVGILFQPGAVRNRDIVIADLAITGSDEAIAMWEAGGSVDGLLLANLETDAIIHCGTGPCRNWRVENVAIDAGGEGWGADAFAVESGDNILLVNVDVTGAGSDGIDSKATRTVILNSRVAGVGNNAIKLQYGGDVINSVISRGSASPIVVEEGRFRLLHATIGYAPELAGHRDYSLLLGYDRRKPMQIEIVNSIIANPSGAVWINPESRAVSIRNTLFFSGDGSEILIHGNIEAGYRDGIRRLYEHYGAGNLAADPLLDAELRPAVTSPTIDAGIRLTSDFPPFDRTGGPRVLDNAPDLGAFEVASH